MAIQVVLENPPVKVAPGATWPSMSVYVDSGEGPDPLWTEDISISVTGGTLNGTLTQTPVEGVATFDGLSAPSPGTLTITGRSTGAVDSEPAIVTVRAAKVFSGGWW